jgi:hypothetical protein
MKFAMAIAFTCLLASAALGTVKWDPDPAGGTTETGNNIAAGNYIGRVDKITNEDDTITYIITTTNNAEGVDGRLLIPASDLTSNQKSTLDTAAAQVDTNNFVHMNSGGDVGSVGSSGPYP